MANTPEAEGQEEQIGEQEQEEEIEEEIEPYVPPKHAKRVYGKPLPSIKLICTKNYSNINRIAKHDHLMDKN